MARTSERLARPVLHRMRDNRNGVAQRLIRRPSALSGRMFPFDNRGSTSQTAERFLNSADASYERWCSVLDGLERLYRDVMRRCLALPAFKLVPPLSRSVDSGATYGPPFSRARPAPASGQFSGGDSKHPSRTVAVPLGLREVLERLCRTSGPRRGDFAAHWICAPTGRLHDYHSCIQPPPSRVTKDLPRRHAERRCEAGT